jgi:hypothetical protein
MSITTMSEPERGSSVGPTRGFRPDLEMNVIGWLVALPLVILLLPVLPFVVLFWLLAKLLGRV